MTSNDRAAEFVNCLSQSSRQVYTFIVSLLPRWGDAEEVFQEVSKTLWEKFAEFETGTDFTAWACRVAYLKVLEDRAKHRRGPLLFSDVFLDALAPEFAKQADALAERQVALLDCLQKLGDRDRELVRRRYTAGATPQQIAIESRRTVSAIHKALSRIHLGLFECIERTLRREDRQ